MSPAPITEILAEADRLLEPGHFEDYCVNGLQVPGPDTVETIASGCLGPGRAVRTGHRRAAPSC